MTGARAALSAATSSHRDLEGSSVRLRGASDVSCVNADNELSLGVIRQIELDLVAFFLLRWLEPSAISRLFIETLTEIESAMENRDKGFRRFNRQKFCEHVRRLAVGHQTAQAS